MARRRGDRGDRGARGSQVMYGWGITFQGSAPDETTPVSTGSSFNWYDCPTGETVLSPADCPHFTEAPAASGQQLISVNQNKILIGAAVFFGLVLLAKAGK